MEIPDSLSDRIIALTEEGEPRRFQLENGARISRRSYEANRWAITRQGYCLTVEGQWIREPAPSERDEEFILRARFTLAGAARAAEGAGLLGQPALLASSRQ